MEVISVSVSEDHKYIAVKTKGDIQRNNYDLESLIEAYELATTAGINHLLRDMTETRNLQSHVDNFLVVNTT